MMTMSINGVLSVGKMLPNFISDIIRLHPSSGVTRYRSISRSAAWKHAFFNVMGTDNVAAAAPASNPFKHDTALLRVGLGSGPSALLFLTLLLLLLLLLGAVGAHTFSTMAKYSDADLATCPGMAAA